MILLITGSASLPIDVEYYSSITTTANHYEKWRALIFARSHTQMQVEWSRLENEATLSPPTQNVLW
jgi:hypothetical protein